MAYLLLRINVGVCVLEVYCSVLEVKIDLVSAFLTYFFWKVNRRSVIISCITNGVCICMFTELTMFTSLIESKLAIVKSMPTYRGSPETKFTFYWRCNARVWTKRYIYEDWFEDSKKQQADKIWKLHFI